MNVSLFQRVSLGVATSILFLPFGALAQRADVPARRLITSRIDENRLVTLRGNTRSEMNVANDAGPVPEDMAVDHMMLHLVRPEAREKALVSLIDRLHDPSSPDFHRWLSASELGSAFGPAPEDTEAITAWLESHGFKVNVVYTSGMMIDFSGSAAQVRDAFHTEIRRLSVNGVSHIANARDPQIPAALAPAIAGIVSLHDFRPSPRLIPRNEYTIATNQEAVVPGDLATIYNFNPVFSGGNVGKGQTVTVIEDTNLYSSADWDTFRATFGLNTLAPSGTLATVHPAPAKGNNNCKDPGVLAGAAGEAILDAEWASAAAPGAAIQVAACQNSLVTFGGLIALVNLLEAPAPPQIVSISYGECEAENGAASNLAFNTAYQIGVARGVSIFVSAGDEGAASCDAGTSKARHGISVSGFATTPYNVAVGGTDYGDTFAGTATTYWNAANSPVFSSAKSYIPEIPWNDSCASALISKFATGSPIPYGSTGLCNTFFANRGLINIVAGSGGPSSCATGTASTTGVVSGTCAGYAKPSWQVGVKGVPSDGVRDIPDVSLFAANGVWGHYYVFCYSNPATGAGGAPCTGAPSTWSGAGGTSFSAPIVAGIQALVNAQYGGLQGNPNYVYYKLAAMATGSTWCNSSNGIDAGAACTFYDVTQGDIDVNCAGTNNCFDPSGLNGVLSTSSNSYSPAFGTTSGWDFATGIGTMNVANLLKNWKGFITPLVR